VKRIRFTVPGLSRPPLIHAVKPGLAQEKAENPPALKAWHNLL